VGTAPAVIVETVALVAQVARLEESVSALLTSAIVVSTAQGKDVFKVNVKIRQTLKDAAEAILRHHAANAAHQASANAVIPAKMEQSALAILANAATAALESRNQKGIAKQEDAVEARLKPHAANAAHLGNASAVIPAKMEQSAPVTHVNAATAAQE
jgi:hypothetical protein